MTAIYKGKPATILRPAEPTELAELVGYVLIRTSEGVECVVAEDDLSESDDEVTAEVTAPTGVSKAVSGLKEAFAKGRAKKPKSKVKKKR